MAIDQHTKQRLGVKARRDAQVELQARHAAEFQELVERNRVALGLSRRADMESAESLRAKLEKARAREQQLLERLAEAEGAERSTARTTKAR